MRFFLPPNYTIFFFLKYRTIFLCSPIEILDGLRDFLSENVLATLSYILSSMNSIVRMLYQVAIVHEDVQHRIYDISTKHHKDTVQKLLTNVDPNFYRTFVKSFSRLNFLEVNLSFPSLESYFAIRMYSIDRVDQSLLRPFSRNS